MKYVKRAPPRVSDHGILKTTSSPLGACHEVREMGTTGGLRQVY